MADQPWWTWSGLAQRMKLQLSPITASGQGWYPIVREPYTGAWQQNVSIDEAAFQTNPTVFACRTLIASDIAKLNLRLVEWDGINLSNNEGVWRVVESPAFSPVLRKPNRYQNRIQFIWSWIYSKLDHGNAYVLKARDARGVVVAMHVLGPRSVQVLEAPDGDVFYRLKTNTLAGISEYEDGGEVAVPASEMIHDRMNTIYHPLVGMSAIVAAGLPAMQAHRIQENSTLFFSNGANPSGVLTAPGPISQETANRLREKWNTGYSGANVGKIAVLGDGLKFEPMARNAVESQLIEQLKWTDEKICSTHHVPAYMVGVGDPPNYNNIQALNQQYYSQCLQVLIESLELALDEGLGLYPQKTADGRLMGSEFDLDDLLRMDSATMMSTIRDGVTSGVLAPNEGRLKLNQGPVAGGETPYLQKQNYSLAALAARGSVDLEDEDESPASRRRESNEATDMETRAIQMLNVKAAALGLYTA